MTTVIPHRLTLGQFIPQSTLKIERYKKDILNFRRILQRKAGFVDYTINLLTGHSLRDNLSSRKSFATFFQSYESLISRLIKVSFTPLIIFLLRILQHIALVEGP